MSKLTLARAIQAVNTRYEKGLNDDDQVVRMIATDRKTKGWTFIPRYDSYEIATDREKLEYLTERYGYWSKEVQRFNETLKQKGGYDYMSRLNCKVCK